MTQGLEINHIPYSGEKGWIGVDLDRTLAVYNGKINGVYDPTHIGEPILPMVERIRGWLMEGYEVRIFTARVGGLEKNSVERSVMTAIIQDWLMGKCQLPPLKVTAEKDMDCCQIWDDIAVTVIRNTGDTLHDQIDRLGQAILALNVGEPTQDQGAVDTAIRLLSDWAAKVS